MLMDYELFRLMKNIITAGEAVCFVCLDVPWDEKVPG
jgi:hypothetical protein